MASAVNKLESALQSVDQIIESEPYQNRVKDKIEMKGEEATDTYEEVPKPSTSEMMNPSRM